MKTPFSILTLLILYFFLLPTISLSQEWQHLGLNGERIETIAIDKTNPNIIFAGSTSDFSSGKTGSLFKTTNGGITWDTLIKYITVRDIDFHPLNRNVVFVTGGTNGLTQSKLLKTNDGGKSWFRSDSGIVITGNTGPFCLEINPNHPDTLFVGTGFLDGGNLYKSIDGGNYWKKVTASIHFQNGITAIGINPMNPSIIMVGTNGTGELFTSTDDGESWIDRGTQDELINTIKFNLAGRTYLGTSSPGVNKGGVFYSDDSFHTWKYLDLPFNSTTHIRRLILQGDTMYARGGDYLYRIINDSGVEKINIVNNVCAEIAIIGSKIFIGTNNGILASNIVVGIKQRDFKTNPVLNLYQNFPNPFNSATVIRYSINIDDYISLKIYNGLGQEIDKYENKIHPGYHSFVFDGTNYTSGVYYCQIITSNTISAKKMILLK